MTNTLQPHLTLALLMGYFCTPTELYNPGTRLVATPQAQFFVTFPRYGICNYTHFVYELTIL